METLYHIDEILWFARNKSLAQPDDDWAWAPILDYRGGTLPSIFALAEDIEHYGYVVEGDYRITISLRKFLHRKRIRG